MVEELQEVSGRDVAEEPDVLRFIFFSEHTDTLGGLVGTGVGVGPDPVGGLAQFVHGFQGLGDLLAGEASLVGDGVLDDDVVILGGESLFAAAAVSLEGVKIELGHDGFFSQVDGRASCDKYVFRIFAHLYDSLRGQFAGDQVEVGKLGDGVADFFIDVAGDFTALDVGQGDVGIGSRDGGGDGLIAVGDGDDDVGLEVLESRHELDHAKACGLDHGDRIFTLYNTEDLAVDRESVVFDLFIGVAVAVEHGGCRHNDLQFHVRRVFDGEHGSFDSGITRSRGDHYAYFPHLVSPRAHVECRLRRLLFLLPVLFSAFFKRFFLSRFFKTFFSVPFFRTVFS